MHLMPLHGKRDVADSLFRYLKVLIIISHAVTTKFMSIELTARGTDVGLPNEGEDCGGHLIMCDRASQG